MKWLLSNDDGFDAPGLDALREAVASRGEFRVYAPVGALSGCSHRLTTDDPIRVVHRGGDHRAVDGTPGDCVRLALHAHGGDVDWVLSGINAGGNLGVDVYYSGTVAAIREAAILGKPGIAFSQYIKKDRAVDWTRVAKWARQVLGELISIPLEPGAFYSVNFPHLAEDEPDPPIIYCPLDRNPLPLHYQDHSDDHRRYAGVYAERTRTPGADVDVCFSGKIAVTRLSTCHGSG